jgi:hypothetical protein
MTAARVLEGMPRRWPLVLILATIALGATVAASWMAFGIDAWQGPGRVLERSWPAIYGSQALLAALVGFRLARHVAGWPAIVAIVLGGWLGELLVLTLFGNLLANEIDPEVAYVFWWMGTGGPLQPIAAILGGLVARSVRSSP